MSCTRCGKDSCGSCPSAGLQHSDGHVCDGIGAGPLKCPACFKKSELGQLLSSPLKSYCNEATSSVSKYDCTDCTKSGVHKCDRAGTDGVRKQGCPVQEDNLKDLEGDTKKGSRNPGITSQPLIQNLGMAKKTPILPRKQNDTSACLSQMSDKSSVFREDRRSNVEASQDDIHLADARQPVPNDKDHGTKITVPPASTEQTTKKKSEPVRLASKDSSTSSIDVNFSVDSENNITPKSRVDSSGRSTPPTAADADKVMRRIQIPIMAGVADRAIEEELLKFYHNAISHICLMVYKEQENELYGRDLSQIGLYDAGRGMTNRAKEQKRL